MFVWFQTMVSTLSPVHMLRLTEIAASGVPAGAVMIGSLMRKSRS
jgi:hypothetical protein